METPMLDRLARMLDARDVTVHRFEFPFMAARSLGLSRRPAPRAETLIADYEDAIAEVRARIGDRSRLFAGGKSMGGRVACLAAGARDAVAGVVMIGFPLCPPRKPHTSRARALDTLERPALIVQGTRDPFGGRAAFEVLALPAHISFHWIDDGDHDLKPRRLTGSTHDDALNEAADAIAQFCTGGG
jgi:predicted alpha/beta-hydrolase family hydrolase